MTLHCFLSCLEQVLGQTPGLLVKVHLLVQLEECRLEVYHPTRHLSMDTVFQGITHFLLKMVNPKPKIRGVPPREFQLSIQVHLLLILLFRRLLRPSQLRRHHPFHLLFHRPTLRLDQQRQVGQSMKPFFQAYPRNSQRKLFPGLSLLFLPLVLGVLAPSIVEIRRPLMGSIWTLLGRV